ncbi:arginine deiminase family protein [Dyadobacter chenhuakuii]|uniref:arginine deiminase n=1 Tax=Dyadobacter chenhuakuii TaxID=2909339 RepID=A0ABY4XLM1_9BACT|nr:arginine deiminase family protein [Dyadobacter chenhuakuii]MCF2493973.1 arginine deiminase family protein [Dyadobacter chenhuakuii]USJ31104.1 arginine deiminase family protein [Dyadobacter chenhuakuii]
MHTEIIAGTAINVASETGTLKRLLIHSPDRGLGKVVPSKAQDWLFEDIVHLDTMRRGEYDYYVKLLLYFLDPEKIKGRLADIDSDPTRSFFIPGSEKYFNSDCVVDIQKLLGEILENGEVRVKLTAAICGIERCSYHTQEELNQYDPHELSKIFISGSYSDKRMLFAPLPNLIFMRDIGIVINDHILLNKPAKNARTRESILAQFVFFYHPMFADIKSRIIEIPENERHFLLPDDEKASDYHRCTLEGGDVMMVAPNHLVIGCSERTSLYAAQQVMKLLFEKEVVTKITIVKIPKKRDYMHIDTIFTQVKKNVWVLLGSLARLGDEAKKQDVLHFFAPQDTNKEFRILQFVKGQEHSPTEIENLEDLLTSISVNDLGVTEPVRFIYSGDNEFPYGEREQWTDSCNLLALKDGVVVGYDRNDKTLDAFRKHGYQVITAKDLIQKLEDDELSVDTLTDTFITLPSAELSRARGGSHCMSMPILRSAAR